MTALWEMKGNQTVNCKRIARHILPGLLLSAIAGIAQDNHEHSQAMASQHSDHMEHRFDNPTESAKDFDDPSRDAWQMPERVIAALKLKAGQSVADIGAGTGYFSVRLARSSADLHVYGVDIEKSMVDYLRSRAAMEGLPNITVVHAGEDSPKLPAAVDVVLIVDTYHHIGNRVDYFRRLSASLKPGGPLAIIDFKPDAPMGPPESFGSRLRRFDLNCRRPVSGR